MNRISTISKAPTMNQDLMKKPVLRNGLSYLMAYFFSL